VTKEATSTDSGKLASNLDTGKWHNNPFRTFLKFTLKNLSQENEGTLAENHLILGHDRVSDRLFVYVNFRVCKRYSVFSLLNLSAVHINLDDC
jgi:hypothetical protein